LQDILFSFNTSIMTDYGGNFREAIISCIALDLQDIAIEFKISNYQIRI